GAASWTAATGNGSSATTQRAAERHLPERFFTMVVKARAQARVNKGMRKNMAQFLLIHVMPQRDSLRTGHDRRGSNRYAPIRDIAQCSPRAATSKRPATADRTRLMARQAPRARDSQHLQPATSTQTRREMTTHVDTLRLNRRRHR
ncbi:MAG TPA: hypothetical protein PKD55_16155, partial [Bellilinea sp.]|nr:hypothetical protein [Bellilinea sp.]